MHTRSLLQKAAQTLMPRLGSNLPPPVVAEADVDRVAALLTRCPVGGLVLFNGQFPETADALARLQRSAEVPLLVGVDMEQGLGQQVRGATLFPHAAAYGTHEDDALLEASAEAAAREALACGLHVTFAPVADVNSNPRNPIIATRAFGEAPDAVARRVRAYVRGARRGGLLTTAKHFPGHGDTSQDSHAELPVVDRDRAGLDALELAPFRAAVDAGADLVMTAHVAFPALDPSGAPATLSRPILHDLLREELGFDGVVVTDSLMMGAVRDRYPDAGAQAVALLQAGVDLLLDVADPEAAAAGLVRAVEDGVLDEARLDDACRRILALKQRLADRFGPGVFTDPSSAAPRSLVGSDAHRRLAERAAAAALQVVRDDGDLLPLDAGDGGDVCVVLVKPLRAPLEPAEAPLGAAVRAAWPRARFVELGPDADADAFRRAAEAADAADTVVAAFVVKPAAWHAFGLPDAHDRFVAALTARRPTVLVALGPPTSLAPYPHAAAAVCAYSDAPPTQRVLPRFLCGA